MSTYTTAGSKSAQVDWRRIPAYGPIDAVLGYVLFYVLVDRATSTIVSVASDIIPNVPASAVRFALAALLWFVLLVTVVDSARRQLAALGFGGYETGLKWPNSKPMPTALQTVAYLATVLVGGTIAVWLFDSAIETAVGLITVVAALDVSAFPVGAFVGLVVFFVSYGAAAHSLDRLLVGGLRAVVTWSIGVE
ncbi:hypothetical protein ACFO0N_21990 [Halobium salinum]|uniref:Uncharacterized protein n=1 Tax=Halobium salinum TaxID=1364940 RepID=A0ABD5PIB5_9EURY|nr:hypothetical protein [Halobium salinum]